jgi:hypothetical protein
MLAVTFAGAGLPPSKAAHIRKPDSGWSLHIYGLWLNDKSARDREPATDGSRLKM